MQLHSTTTTTTYKRPSRKQRWLRLAEETYQVQQELKQQREYYDKLRAELKELSDNESFAYKGYFHVKSVRKGNIQYTEIPAVKELLKKIDSEQYRSQPVESWKLTKED